MQSEALRRAASTAAGHQTCGSAANNDTSLPATFSPILLVLAFFPPSDSLRP